jgi:hypothetical protein
VLEIAVEQNAPISVEEFQIAVVDADPHLLTSTVMNLLLNAFENTSPTGRRRCGSCRGATPAH